MRYPWVSIMCLFLCLCLYLCLPLTCGSVAAATSDGKKQVLVLRYRIEPNHFGVMLDVFRDRMARHGLLPDEHIEYIDILTKSADKDSVPEIVEAVERYRHSADLVVSCGWVSLPVRELLKETTVPQLFVPVLEGVARKMLPSLKNEPNTNLSGLYLMYPPEKVLRLARLILPGLQRYAYVYDSRVPADESFHQAYEALPPHARHGIEIVCLDLARGTEPVLTELRTGRIDAYGGIVGLFTQREAFHDLALPVITAYTLDIEAPDIPSYTAFDNTVAGLFNPFSFCGQQAADMGAAVLLGRQEIARLRPQPARQMAFINLRNATRLGVMVPSAAIESVDLVLR